jgi:hypothetical protein
MYRARLETGFPMSFQSRKPSLRCVGFSETQLPSSKPFLGNPEAQKESRGKPGSRFSSVVF